MTMAQWRPTPLIYTSMLLWTVGYCAVMLLPFCVASLLPEEARGRFSRWVILQYGRVMVYRAVWPFVRVTRMSPTARYSDRSQCFASVSLTNSPVAISLETISPV